VNPAEALPSRLIGAAQRVPASLAEFAGSGHGRVSLPEWLAWSGPREFDVSDPGQRLTLYHTLLDCGQREEIIGTSMRTYFSGAGRVSDV
jgi:hypothetical protein